MKKMLITLCALFLLTTTMYAQRDLKTYPVFQGEVVPGKMMVVTEVRGSGMATYKLDAVVLNWYPHTVHSPFQHPPPSSVPHRATPSLSGHILV